MLELASLAEYSFAGSTGARDMFREQHSSDWMQLNLWKLSIIGGKWLARNRPSAGARRTRKARV